MPEDLTPTNPPTVAELQKIIADQEAKIKAFSSEGTTQTNPDILKALADVEALQELVKQLDTTGKAEAELTEAKTALETLRRNSMTEQERLKHELAQNQKRLAEMEAATASETATLRAQLNATMIDHSVAQALAGADLTNVELAEAVIRRFGIEVSDGKVLVNYPQTNETGEVSVVPLTPQEVLTRLEDGGKYPQLFKSSMAPGSPYVNGGPKQSFKTADDAYRAIAANGGKLPQQK